jgi:hypothetical protein
LKTKEIGNPLFRFSVIVTIGPKYEITIELRLKPDGTPETSLRAAPGMMVVLVRNVDSSNEKVNGAIFPTGWVVNE